MKCPKCKQDAVTPELQGGKWFAICRSQECGMRPITDGVKDEATCVSEFHRECREGHYAPVRV